MTDVGPVERAISILHQAGYTQLQSPVVIAGVPFEFGAVMVGGDRALDLVVIADTVGESDRRLRQRIEAVGRALDVAGSRRSLTVVTVGPPPAAQTVDSMSRVARVLVVKGEREGGTTLSDTLAVLLPLTLPSVTAEATEPFDTVQTWLHAEGDRADLEPVVAAAVHGESAVADALAEFLTVPLTPYALED